jgi:hypothetical protein
MLQMVAQGDVDGDTPPVPVEEMPGGCGSRPGTVGGPVPAREESPGLCILHRETPLFRWPAVQSSKTTGNPSPRAWCDESREAGYAKWAATRGVPRILPAMEAIRALRRSHHPMGGRAPRQ